MRVALISDLHANESALRAVLMDAKSYGVDQIVCLGDIATLGPQPHETLDIVRALNCPCIMGNHDEFLLKPGLIHMYTEARIVLEAVDWCCDGSSDEELDFIRSFRTSLEIELAPDATLRVFHGSPRSHMEDILATTPEDELAEMLGDQSATVFAGGHTHIQMLRQFRGMLVVNPGSVGLPFRDYVAGKAPTLLRHAEYAIVEDARGTINVSLRRVPFDLTAHRRALAASKNPMAPILLQQYV